MPPIYGLTGILIVFSLKFYPYVYLLVWGALSNVNRSLERQPRPRPDAAATHAENLLPARVSGPVCGRLLALIHAIADFGTPRCSAALLDSRHRGLCRLLGRSRQPTCRWARRSASS